MLQTALKAPEEEEEEKKVIMSLAAAKVISMDDAVLAKSKEWHCALSWQKQYFSFNHQ